MKKFTAYVELILATMIWGLGFVMAIWALEGIGPLYLSAIRFGVAFIASTPFFLLPSMRAHWKFQDFWTVAPSGLFLAVSILLQTCGLQYTTATNSGFITCLYVILVPIIEMGVYRKKLPAVHLLWVFIALVGTALIVDYRISTGFNYGDGLTLICGFLLACQILAVDRAVSSISSAFVFNTIQSFWAFLVSILAALLLEDLPRGPMTPLVLGSTAFLTFGSVMIAFMLQVRAQKILSPSVSSLLFLLESPFAAIAGFALLGESLGPLQMLGALLILTSAFAATQLKNTNQMPEIIKD